MITNVRLHGKLEKLFGSEVLLPNIRKPQDVIRALDTRFPNFKTEVIEMEKLGMFFQILYDGETVQHEFELNAKRKIVNVDIAPCIVGSGPVAAVIAVVGGVGIMATGATIFGLSAAASFALGLGLALAGVTFLMNAPDDITPEDQEATVRGESFYFSTQANSSVQGSAVPLNYGLLRVGSKVVSNSLRNYNREDFVEPVSTRRVGRPKGGNSKTRRVRLGQAQNRPGQGAEGYRSVASSNSRKNRK